jgi:kynurenine formamidase
MKRWTVRPEGSNWGEFGDDDQVGRMNLITPERRLRAAREVQEGIAFCLSLPLDFPGGAELIHTRKPPRLFSEPRGDSINFNFPLSKHAPAFTDVVCDDAVLLYTQYSTQWDALGHVGSTFDPDGDGKPKYVYYNGYRADVDLHGPSGEHGPHADALGIENLAVTAVQGRGTLVDLKSAVGEHRSLVGYDALMRAIESQKADVEAGDFLCLYTGYADAVLSMNRKPDKARLATVAAELNGRDTRLLNWITDSGLVAICADNLAVEAFSYPEPALSERYAAIPLHEHCIFRLGIDLGELWYFTELAAWLAAHQRAHFLLTAPPLRLPGSVGSPMTPVATV